jgi:hypothetical protein
MALRLIRDLPGAPGFLATVAGAMRKHRRQLGISVGMPGPHDFAVLPGLFVGSRSARCNSDRPPHPWLNVRDDRETPLFGQAGTRENVNLICPTTQPLRDATR